MNQLGLGWGYPTLGFRPLKIKKYCVPSLTPTTKFKGTRKNMSEIWEPFNNTAYYIKQDSNLMRISLKWDTWQLRGG